MREQGDETPDYTLEMSAENWLMASTRLCAKPKPERWQYHPPCVTRT